MAFAGAFSPSLPPSRGPAGAGMPWIALPPAASAPGSPALSCSTPRLLPSRPSSPAPGAADRVAAEGEELWSSAPDEVCMFYTTEEDTARTPCQFAPLLDVRRKQSVEDAVVAAAGLPPGGCSLGPASTEELLHDALDAMDALCDARRSADHIRRSLTGEHGPDEEWALPPPAVDDEWPEFFAPLVPVPPATGIVASAGDPLIASESVCPQRTGETLESSSFAGSVCEGRAFGGVASDCSTAVSSSSPVSRPEPRTSISNRLQRSLSKAVDGLAADKTATSVFSVASNVGASVASVAGAAATTVAEAIYTAATGNSIDTSDVCYPASGPDDTTAALSACEPGTHYVEGVLSLRGDIATAPPEGFTETLRMVLLRLVGPLVEVGGVDILGPFAAGDATAQASAPPAWFWAIGAAAAPLVCLFVFRVGVLDPHDVDPLRETLLLEAESGGARSLLPLLAEQLSDDGHPTPRHLKIGLEVRSGCGVVGG